MSLLQISKPHTFVLGSDYFKAEVEISTTHARVIERAAQMKSPGKIWLSATHGIYQVGNYDGAGGVFNGNNSLTKASPEQMALMADAHWSRAGMGLLPDVEAVGGPAFYREDPWQKSPVFPLSQYPSGTVRAFSVADGMPQTYQAGQLMSVGELIGQMKNLLAEKSAPDWEKHLLDRIEGLGLAAVASGRMIHTD